MAIRSILNTIRAYLANEEPREPPCDSPYHLTFGALNAKVELSRRYEKWLTEEAVKVTSNIDPETGKPLVTAPDIWQVAATKPYVLRETRHDGS